VRRALENTARPLGGDAPDAKLTYGCGLLQVLIPTASRRTICSASAPLLAVQHHLLLQCKAKPSVRM
jgi:hypothetical protein